MQTLALCLKRAPYCVYKIFYSSPLLRLTHTHTHTTCTHTTHTHTTHTHIHTHTYTHIHTHIHTHTHTHTHMHTTQHSCSKVHHESLRPPPPLRHHGNHQLCLQWLPSPLGLLEARGRTNPVEHSTHQDNLVSYIQRPRADIP